MTHFPVIVCTDDPGDLENIMLPWWEEREGVTDPKWDWFVIGGRWSGYFRYKRGMPRELRIEPPYPHSSLLPQEKAPPYHCDGGRVKALDLEGMRRVATDSATERYNIWERLTEGKPQALPWRSFADNISEGNGYTAQQARDEYHSQPMVQAIKGSALDFPLDDAIEEFDCSRNVYVERARAQAVPGYAHVTLDGKWVAPGEMGWWGMHSDSQQDRLGYLEVANAYFGTLDSQVWMICVDCHI